MKVIFKQTTLLHKRHLVQYLNLDLRIKLDLLLPADDKQMLLCLLQYHDIKATRCVSIILHVQNENN